MTYRPRNLTDRLNAELQRRGRLDPHGPIGSPCADEGRRTAPTLAEAQAQLDAVKAALTEQYRTHRRHPPRQEPQPPAWLTEDYWRQALAADAPSPKATRKPNSTDA